MEQIPVWLYSLSTCSMCKELKQLLSKNKIQYETIDMDRLDKQEQSEILDLLKSYNPKMSFPTLVAGDEVIVGFNREKINTVIKTLKKQNKFSFKKLFKTK